MNNEEIFFKELTGKTYREYAHYLDVLNRIIIDELLKLEKEGKISKDTNKIIWKKAGQHFVQNFPDLLPPT